MNQFHRLLFILLSLTSVNLYSQNDTITEYENLINGELINKTINIKALSSFNLVKKLESQDKAFLGDLYIKYTKDTLFNSLIIIKDSIVIYEINYLNFWNTKGIDFDIPKNRIDYYGLVIRFVKNDFLVIGYLIDSGKNMADDITLEWNYEKKVFEIRITP